MRGWRVAAASPMSECGTQSSAGLGAALVAEPGREDGTSIDLYLSARTEDYHAWVPHAWTVGESRGRGSRTQEGGAPNAATPHLTDWSTPMRTRAGAPPLIALPRWGLAGPARA